MYFCAQLVFLKDPEQNNTMTVHFSLHVFVISTYVDHEGRQTESGRGPIKRRGLTLLAQCSQIVHLLTLVLNVLRHSGPLAGQTL